MPSGEILSQNEIDALLSALSTGEVNAEEIKKEEEEKKIRTYDFKRALRFSKEQIRSLTRIHDNLARLLTTYFSAKLRTYVHVEVASADQIPYEEFVRSIPKMTVLYLYEVPPLEGRLLIEINPNIAYAMLDRILGGMGTSINKIDQLTDIETKIMTNLFENAFEQLQEAWETVTHINPVLQSFEVNPQFLQMVSPNETVVVISLNTVIGETSGMINICIPHIVLEPIISKLSVSYWMQTEKKQAEPEKLLVLKRHLKHTQLPVIAELGQSEITIEEFLNLTEGDCIELNRKIDQPIIIKVEGKPKFLAQPGKINNKLAVQILEELKEGDENDE
ncbi:flagellar motor switch protein FliM [Caldifermentibacillus hisashii]|uniref:flagellar motor switch protein FliM n=1 Tax=Caldifermentibacillus hisashii TaxID=996558 RepID=UPI001C104C9E|nr:flagellar motor switch protein FliM [Caldifermentibacillus hisashii]MBU5341114.1 flagellar motor switch protein FliM [Caldifermentibacillus hisashii]